MKRVLSVHVVRTLSALASSVLATLLIACSCPPPEHTPFAGVKLVNMVPNTMSGETRQDSEPFLAIDFSNPNRMAGSAFTPNPFGTSGNAPIYVTSDGGDSWLLNFTVPSNGEFGTSDITIAGTHTPSRLHSGILRIPGSLLLNILRSNDFVGNSTLSVQGYRPQVDQPFIQAMTIGTTDRVYVANNDFNALDGRTATVDVSLDGGTMFRTVRIETRSTGGAQQDGPSVRPAIANDGTVYVAYFGWRSFLANNTAYSDIVVVRDDNGAAGTNPFRDLVEPTDNQPGRIVAHEVRIPWSNQPTLGNERIGSTLSIAVHPTNSNIVYVAWADGEGSTYTLHVRRSIDRGQTWSADVRRVENATCAAVAVAANGTAGFLYQRVTGSSIIPPCNGRWETHLEQSTNGFASYEDILLANVPADKPDPEFLPYIGDYNFLVAVGNEFRGVFSASNEPDRANFPNGITYQRNVDFDSNTLLSNDGGSVRISIDPFYFSVPVR